ncbi:MAG: Uma2 family endonuclease [Chloroflexi bacterium]|nr:Uma2 family endonuclease [Chloroflexota bacterium]
MTDKTETCITAEEWLRSDDDARIEVLDGEFVAEDDENMTAIHVRIIDNLYRLLFVVVKTAGLGELFTEGLKYVLKREGRKILIERIPDLSFVRRERFPADFNWSGHFEGAPDLAVEVALPGQATEKLIEKIADYLKYGTQETWLLFPDARELHRYQNNTRPPRIYRDGETLDGETLFPGLHIALSDVFKLES